MIDVEPKDLSVRQAHWYLLGGVAPRPIALVSTLSEDGVPNLSPFSFFNAFGANPPTVAFSPSRRGRDGSTKDTYKNLVKTRECVIQAVTHDIVEQVNLASTEYPSDTDEFVKSGLTPVKSDLVRPFRVKESPFQMECRLQQMVELGGGPGSGNLAICEVVKYHIAEDIVRDGIIVPELIDLVGRNGGNFYTRASGKAVFELPKPSGTPGIGFDKLPGYVLKSDILSANNLGQLAGAAEIPSVEEACKFVNDLEIGEANEEAFQRYRRQHRYTDMLTAALGFAAQNQPNKRIYFELTAREALDYRDLTFAWNVLVYASTL